MGEGSMIWKRVKEEEDENSILEQEEALVALIEHRTKEVQHLRQRISYYQSQLAEAEERLQDSQSKLAHLGGRHISSSSNASLATKRVKVELGIVPPEDIDGDSEILRLRTKLVIPSVIPKFSKPIKPEGLVAKSTIALEEITASNRAVKVKVEESDRSSTDMEVVEVIYRGTKRMLEQEERKELITLVESHTSPTLIGPYSSNIIPSQHKRKSRSLSVCPVNDQLFVTSALDGLVNLWKILGRGSSASLLSTTNCVSSGARR
ncbi:ERF114 protein [Hibiscus syriacus]|uniref:ERF114 protein n=1 Tax=Hibiscus syriacus TaxID=106335 RepID=A0A6A2Y740_HIBSY|nr:ERF114 protein [Hibiscus syriacus]